MFRENTNRTGLKSRKTNLYFLLVFLLSTAAATEIAGVSIPDRVEVGGTKLGLNGAGIRSKFFVKVYVGALYLPRRTQAASEIIAMDGPKRVIMHFLHDEVSREKLVDAWTEGFENNQGEEQLKALRPRIDRFNKLFQTVYRGDVITLDYTPEQGTVVSINGIEKGAVEGSDFCQALLTIWLGDSPADEDLKQGLLGL
ncbi:MAG: chalcone isomerase family protein [Gammaproteobacteria bacterium]